MTAKQPLCPHTLRALATELEAEGKRAVGIVADLLSASKQHPNKAIDKWSDRADWLQKKAQLLRRRANRVEKECARV
jgi:hypothetical protein